MNVKIASVVFESTNAEELMKFWEALLAAPSAFNPESGWGAVVADNVTISTKPAESQELPGLEKGSRVHLDIEVENLESATDKAVALGATIKRGPFGEAETGQYTVFADIDGNAFCLYTDPAGAHGEIIEAIRSGVIS